MNNEEISNQIRSFLIEELGISPSTSNEDSLFSGGILDSLDILSIITFFENKLSVKFSPFEVGLEQLDTIDLMVRAVIKKS